MVRMHSDVKKFKWKQYYFKEEQFRWIIDTYWINSLQNFREDLSMLSQSVLIYGNFSSY